MLIINKLKLTVTKLGSDCPLLPTKIVIHPEPKNKTLTGPMPSFRSFREWAQQHNIRYYLESAILCHFQQIHHSQTPSHRVHRKPHLIQYLSTTIHFDQVSCLISSSCGATKCSQLLVCMLHPGAAFLSMATMKVLKDSLRSIVIHFVFCFITLFIYMIQYFSILDLTNQGVTRTNKQYLLLHLLVLKSITFNG